MHHALRTALRPVLVLGVASALGGCKTHCTKNADGTETCTAETTIEYEGAPLAAQQIDWTYGQALRIGVTGANVTFGELASVAITVNVHGTVTAIPGCTDVTKVCVQFTPINNETKKNEVEARRQMKLIADGGNLAASAINDGSVRIDVHSETNGTQVSSGLSARVDVLIPADFDGDLVAITTNRKISVTGARRGLDVETDNGDIFVSIPDDLVPAPSDANNRIVRTKLGDITFNASSAANISIQAETTGVDSNFVTIDNVSGWYAVEGSTSQASTFCGNSACNAGYTDGNWSLSTELGDVTVTLR